MRYPRNLRLRANPPRQLARRRQHRRQFVLNYEGGENCVLHGDAASEAFWPMVGATLAGRTALEHQSMYEYGARAGFWRLHRLFAENGLPVTVYGVATALIRAPEQVEAMLDADWEIASHGLKWVEHKDMPREEEPPRSPRPSASHHRHRLAPARLVHGRCSINTGSGVRGGRLCLCLGHL